MGVAKDTGWRKQSGFCEYPLFVFDEAWLRSLSGEPYEVYERDFNKAFEEDEDEEP